MNLQQTIDDLFLSQRNEWKLLDTAIKQLDNVKLKILSGVGVLV